MYEDFWKIKKFLNNFEKKLEMYYFLKYNKNRNVRQYKEGDFKVR